MNGPRRCCSHGKNLVDVGVRRWRSGSKVADIGNAKAASHRIVARTQLVPGAVVWARVPFEEAGQYKIRPCVVLRCLGRDVTVLPCTTSEARRRLPGLVELRHPALAGLSRATAVRRQPLLLDHIEILNVLGRLQDEDLAALSPSVAARRASMPAFAPPPVPTRKRSLVDPHQPSHPEPPREPQVDHRAR